MSDSSQNSYILSNNLNQAMFQTYLTAFNSLFSVNNSKYVNSNHGLSLLSLENLTSLSDKDEKTFIFSVAYFINNNNFGNMYYLLELDSEEKVEKNIKILDLVQNSDSFVYEVNEDNFDEGQIDYTQFLPLFSHIKKLSNPSVFKCFSEKAIKNNIEVPIIYYLDLDNIPLEAVYNYSKTHPNKIKELYSFEEKNFS